MDSTYDNQRIVDVEIDKEVKKSFINYAMSVIVARALPDVRDGMKPVHRRILYAMYEDGLTHSKAYRKSVTTVGNVLGRYHPHGDASVYEAMVRMAQPFSLRYPLIDGQGNFGNVDGDGAAAYRYTEARMDRLADEMLTDIDKDVVDFVPNFDNKLREPEVLPSRFPNLLVNGSVGIAVGMATNIPPHNLGEVIDGVVAAIDNPDISILDLMQYIKGPDFPTAGICYGTAGVIEGYLTGRGRAVVRSRAEIEEYKKTHRIIVTEIPYQVNKVNLIIAMADLVKDKRIDGITDIRDESGRAGMRIVIDLRRDVNPNLVLNQLYKFTQLQDTFAINMIALVNGEPKTLNLGQMVRLYIEHQVDVLTRRIRHDLERAKTRAHIYRGLKIAIDNLDEVISIIRSSPTTAEAKTALVRRFSVPGTYLISNDERFNTALYGVGENAADTDFSEAQAQAIVELPLGRLAGLELEKIFDELLKLQGQIDEFNDILLSDGRINAIIKADLLEIKRRYNDERRTEITVNDDEIIMEDLIPREESIVTMTEAGYIKRQPRDTYQAQKRGGRGISAMGTKEDDIVTDMFAANSHDRLMMFTSRGKVYTKKCYEIPSASRISKGTNMVNLLDLEPGETVTTIIPAGKNTHGYLFMVTKNGTIKRTKFSEYDRVNKAGKIAITLDEGDELAFVLLTSGRDSIMIAASSGSAVRIGEASVRATGRMARGVRGIRLADGASVAGVTLTRTHDAGAEVIHSPDVTDAAGSGEDAGAAEADENDENIESAEPDEIADAAEPDDIDDETEPDDADDGEEGAPAVQPDDLRPTMLTITRNGFGKRVPFEAFAQKNRGGKGMICHRINEKTGELVSAVCVSSADDIMIITSDGTMIRTPAAGIPVYANRSSAGVIMMRLAEGVTVKSVARVEAEPEDEEE